MRSGARTRATFLSSKLIRPQETLSYKETLQMRRNYIGKSCKLHFDVAPLKCVRAQKQYMYDDVGNEYLDCINNVAHVGHCHPHVVQAGQEQMALISTCFGFMNDQLALYAKRIIQTLPEQLCVCYFVNSGSEANDVALRLAKAYTKNEDIIVVDNAYHGNLDSLLHISPTKFKKLGIPKEDYVHVVPSPDIYRGKYREGVDNPGLLYANEVKSAIQKAQEKGRRIAAFICEPLMSQCGVINPPTTYLQNAYRHVREAGGVCIADEIQVGLGRVGDNYWAFQLHDVVPDILTVGKPLGNGHPMAMVVTTREVADALGEFSSTYGGNPVSCAIGIAVLDVINNEKLMSSAKFVGRTVLESFRNIMDRHPMMGDVRGVGLVIGIEIVTDKESRKPAKEAAELLSYKMKQEKILMANDGPDMNIMYLTPPLCFTVENARRVVASFDRCLTDIESGMGANRQNNSEAMDLQEISLQVPLNVITDKAMGLGLNKSDDEEFDGPGGKRARFEDLD